MFFPCNRSAEARPVRPLPPLLPTLKTVGPLGGSGDDAFNALALGKDGTAYLVGSTRSRDFALAGPPRTGTDLDAVVVSLRRTEGKWSVMWARRFGGRLDDEALAVAVDTQGRVVIGGKTASPNFPITPNAVQMRRSGELPDGFIATMEPDSAEVTFSSYYGGVGEDGVSAIAVLSLNSIAVGGSTESAVLPTVGSSRSAERRAPHATGGGTDGFVGVLRFQSRWRTVASPALRVGGAGSDHVNALAVGRGGRIFLGGSTDSPAFGLDPDGPLKNAALGGTDAFLARADRAGANLHYVARFGSTAEDSCWSLAALRGLVFAGCGSAGATEFPVRVTLGSPSGVDGLLMGFTESSAGLTPVQSVVLGGSGDEVIRSIAVSESSGVVEVGIGGSTTSADLPTINRAIGDPGAPTMLDGFVGVLQARDPLFRSLQLAGLSYVSGPAADSVSAVGQPKGGVDTLLFAGATESWTRTVVPDDGVLGNRGLQDGLLGALRFGGVAPAITVAPTGSLDFGSAVTVGSVRTQPVTVKNTGGSAANIILAIVPDVPFSVPVGLDRIVVIQPGESVSVDVVYAPLRAGIHTAKLDVSLLSPDGANTSLRSLQLTASATGGR